MNKIQTTAIGTALATLIGGSVYVGNEVGKPQCDYVIQNQAQEICLTQAQAEALFNSLKSAEGVGFGGVKFGAKAPILKK